MNFRISLYEMCLLHVFWEIRFPPLFFISPPQFSNHFKGFINFNERWILGFLFMKCVYFMFFGRSDFPPFFLSALLNFLIISRVLLISMKDEFWPRKLSSNQILDIYLCSFYYFLLLLSCGKCTWKFKEFRIFFFLNN